MLFKVEGSDDLIEAEDKEQAEAFTGLKLIPLNAVKKAKVNETDAE